MPPEEDGRGDAENGAAPENVPVQPEELTDEVFREMYLEGNSGGFPMNTAVDKDPESPSEPAVAAEHSGAESDPGQSPDVLEELAALRGEIARLGNAQTQPQPQTQQYAPPKSVEDMVRERNPDMQEGDVKWLVDQVQLVAGSMVEDLKGQLGYVMNRLQEQDRQATVQSFDQHVNRLMDQHDIDDPFTRRTMRHAIVNEGLERFGANFNSDTATQMFRQLNNERLRQMQERQESYVSQKKEAVRRSPPVSAPTGTRSAVASVRAQVRDSGNRSMDFRGAGMEKLVSGMLDALERQADNAVGASRG
jgi:hypothetical protein